MLRFCFAFVLALVPGLPVTAGAYANASSVAAVGAAGAEIAGPLRVIDGDTMAIGTTRLRLHGIDAPEIGQTCATEGNRVFDCGVWIADAVRTRFEGRTARCTPLTQDRYGRVVARCSVNGTDLGHALVADGLAFAYRRYSMAYDLDEKRAAVASRGLHALRVQSPDQFRRAARPPTAAVAAPTGCVIKGNISASGRIFHSPGQRDYERTVISPDRGERWFCSVAQARAAGWRAAKR